MVLLKTTKQIDGIRKSCRIVAFVLKELYENIKPGVSTAFLNEMAEELCFEKGGTPAFKGYRGFPYSICSSRNEEIVHGFPSPMPLIEGEILSIDFGVLYKGWHGDSAFTKGVGKISGPAEKLIQTTRESLYKGIKAAVPGNRLGDVGHAVQSTAESAGFSVVKEFVGHGIGRELHEEPQVLNYGRPGEGLLIKPGMVIAIEPMVNQGTEKTHTMPDKWTTITEDHKLSAHWEHTIAILETGPEILTERD